MRLLLADGYDAAGIDVSPEQVELAGMPQVRLGNYRDVLAEAPGALAAVTATDVLEHLAKDEVLEALDAVVAALRSGGVLVARVPNAVSPLGGHIRYGDFTHETWYTARSVRQLAAAAGFTSVEVRACPPACTGSEAGRGQQRGSRSVACSSSRSPRRLGLCGGMSSPRT